MASSAAKFLLLLSGGGGAVASTLLDGLVSYWNLNEASGARADSVGSNTLTDNNTVGSAAGISGNAASFVAANSESLKKASAVGLPDGDVDLCIACWIHPTAVVSNQTFVHKGNTQLVGATSYRLQINASNLAQFVISDGAALNSLSGDAIAVDTTYFIVAYHDATNNLMGIIVNNATPDTKAHATGINTTSDNFAIGATYNGVTYFTGWVDEVAIWNRLLTADEITWMYNSGAGRSFAEIQAYTG